jgi:glycosyltransferase involved in cell wall biosynthesis
MKKNKKILFIDISSEGHHISYANTIFKQINSRKDTKILLFGDSEFIDTLKRYSYLYKKNDLDIKKVNNIFDTIYNKYKEIVFFKKAIKFAQKNKVDIIHILYIDNLIISLFLSLKFSNFFDVKLIATLHHVNLINKIKKKLTSRIKYYFEKYLFKKLVSKETSFIVHSNKLKNKLINVTSCNNKFIFSIPYPLSESLSNGNYIKDDNFMYNKLTLNKNIKKLLVFGGTRFDKGTDYAIKSLVYLPGNVHIIIAGKEEFFSKDYLTSLAKKLNVFSRVHFDMKYISDENMIQYFLNSDIILLPYRKSFTGQSGPLTIAASLGIPVVGSNAPVLEETIKEFNLGNVFESGNIKDMSKKISKTLKSEISRNNDAFMRKHSSLSFFKKLNNIYKDCEV